MWMRYFTRMRANGSSIHVMLELTIGGRYRITGYNLVFCGKMCDIVGKYDTQVEVVTSLD